MTAPFPVASLIRALRLKLISMKLSFRVPAAGGDPGRRLLLLSGCATPEGENLLTKAGFDPVRADTTAQIEALKKLSADAIHVVHRNGRTFYVLADPPGGSDFRGQ